MFRAWRTSIAEWWSGAFFEFVTAGLLITLITPWLIGIVAIARWTWMHLR